MNGEDRLKDYRQFVYEKGYINVSDKGEKKGEKGQALYAFKARKTTKTITGLDGIYSLKRLSEKA